MRKLLWQHLFLGFFLLWGITGLLWQESRKGFDGVLHVFFFHVPVGDAFLIKTPHGKTVFVDGGIDETVLSKLSSHLPFWYKTVDLLIISHPDLDHFAGGAAVLGKYTVKNVLISGAYNQSPLFSSFLDEVQQRKIPVFLGTIDTAFWIDGLSFDVLFPLQKHFVGERIKSMNDSSLVFRTVFGDISFLFTGDIGMKVENKLLMSPLNMKSTILKVAHHGSKTSSGSSFLQMVSPKMAVVSAGAKNRFGHPHEEVLERIQKNDTEIFITKEQGDIHVFSDGKEFWVEIKNGIFGDS